MKFQFIYLMHDILQDVPVQLYTVHAKTPRFTFHKCISPPSTDELLNALHYHCNWLVINDELIRLLSLYLVLCEVILLILSDMPQYSSYKSCIKLLGQNYSSQQVTLV